MNAMLTFSSPVSTHKVGHRIEGAQTSGPRQEILLGYVTIELNAYRCREVHSTILLSKVYLSRGKARDP